jgi:hypothetical protein
MSSRGSPAACFETGDASQRILDEDLATPIKPVRRVVGA